MAARCILDNAYVDGCICLAKLRTQHGTEYSSGIDLDTGAHAVLLSAYLLGVAAIFTERTIFRLHAHHPAVGQSVAIF